MIERRTGRKYYRRFYIMGWTGYHATYYDRRGNIDRKAELDERMAGENEYGKWEVLKSSMRGSVYYAAIRRTMPDGNSHVFGCVCLTSVDNSDYCNFSYKDMSEDMGPGESKCPVSILDLLSPTENEYALAWRKRCRENAKNGNALGKLPIGAVIEYEWGDRIMRAEKRARAYQFKTPWWKIVGDNKYCPKSRIPRNFTVISAATA